MTTDIHTLTAPYALDALDQAERERFEAHLESCADCQAELGGFLATAVRLGQRHETAPPAHLKANILAAVSRTPQERPVVTSLAARRSLRHVVPRLLTAAAVVLGLVGVGASVVEHNQRNDVQAEQTAMSTVLGASDAKMTSSSITKGGAVHMVASKKADAAVMVASDLPTLTAKRVYQLWTIRDGKAASAGLLDDATSMKLVTHISAVDAMAITVEPDGGSTAPTTRPIVAMPTL